MLYLNTPQSLSIYLLLQNNEWDQLAIKKTSPHHYLDTISGINKYYRDCQASDFLRKYPLPTSVSRRKVAIDTFRKCEEICYSTNHFLTFLALKRSCDPRLDALSGFLDKAKRKIRRWLGPIPDALTGRFGPGTTFELKGQPYNTVLDKITNVTSVTLEALPVWDHTVSDVSYIRVRQRLGLAHYRTVRGNRFTTVPKDGSTDRGICIEPGANLWCQLGVGAVLKAKLAQIGIFTLPPTKMRGLLQLDTEDGQPIHRRIARSASVESSFASIDLKSASDTVSFELVRWLLPPDWFELLCSLRSPKTLIENTWVHLSKFSSMGNGFTFELETLIFLALCCSVVPDATPGENVFVFGDDILVPNGSAASCLAILTMAGFTPNPSKTFDSSAFRESCGGDYFDGWNVRPVQVKGELVSPQQWVALHNQLRFRFPGYRRNKIVSAVPTRYRLFGPSQVREVFHHSDSRRWILKHRHGILWIKCLKTISAALSLERWPSWAHIYYGLVTGRASGGVVTRGCILSTTTDFVSIS